MMKTCLAPLMLIASTVAPHAEKCPVLPPVEDFVCRPIDPPASGNAAGPIRKAEVQLPLKLRRVDGGYVASYGPSQFNLVPGAGSEPVPGGKTRFSTTSCGRFVNGKKAFDAYKFSRLTSGESVTKDTWFYNEKEGLVAMMYESQGANRHFVGGMRCQQVPR